MALMVLWVEAMGRGEWVGGIDGERIFFYIPAHLPWGCIQNCEGNVSLKLCWFIVIADWNFHFTSIISFTLLRMLYNIILFP